MSKTMKKFLVSILVLGTILSSCTSFLNVDTLGKSTIKGFFTDVDGLRSAGVGLHYLLLDFVDDEYIVNGEVPGDKINVNRVAANLPIINIFDFTSLPEDAGAYPTTSWKSAYEICTNANNILVYGKDLLTKYPDSADIINKHFAYAYFARAYAHFCLLNIFAQPYSYTPDASHLGVVYIDYIAGFESEIKRNSVAYCYDKIISDLLEARRLFGDNSCPDPNYINGLACEALLARVYLYKNDYQKAEEYASKVIAQRSLTPRDKYINMFRKAQEEQGSEAILRLNAYNTTSTIGNMCAPTRSDRKLVPTAEFCASISNQDIRKELYTYHWEASDEQEYQGLITSACCKYLAFKDGVQDELNRRSDPFVLRVSEMHLIRAEALCHIQGADLSVAENDLKLIKARALGCNVSDITILYSSPSELDALVQEERAIELHLEGHRFYDLKRRGQNVIRPASTSSLTKRLDYPSYKFVLPINQTEMESNMYMQQNEGY